MKRVVLAVALAVIASSVFVAAGGKPPSKCTYSLSPTSASFGPDAGSGTIAVTSEAGCGWSAVSNGAFVTVTGGASGSGNGTVSYTVAPNTATTARSATITVAKKTFTVKQAAAPVPPPPPPPPPPPSLDPAYATSDVGAVGLAGSATSSNGTFTVAGAGADIWGTADAFRFVYQPLTGDGSIVARVVSMQNTHAYAKAGIMLRDGLSASAGHVLLDMKPSGELEFMSRATAAASTSWIAGAAPGAPAFIRLSRGGSLVTAYLSHDGANWSAVGSTTVSLPATIDVGLIVCSHDTTVLNTAVFDSVSVTAGPPPNLAPTAYAGTPQTVTGGSTVTLYGSGTDPEGHALAYRWTQISGPAVTLSDPAVAVPSFVAPAAVDASQGLEFQLVVNDGVQDSRPSSVAVTVRGTSEPPPTSLLPAPPAGGATIPVPAGADLQAAIDAAKPGDVIVLDAGAAYVGNFHLPAKVGTSYVMIRSSASFTEGTRVGPSTPGLAKVVSPNAEPAIVTAAGASFYWLEGLELRTAGGANDIVRLGDGSTAQNSLSQVPHDLVVSHCYVHGLAGVEQKRGIALNSGLTYIADSHIDEIKGDGYDTQAICGWNGPGPYRIYNNRLEAAGEVILFGGSDPAIQNLVPTDIVVRGNLLTRPTSWRTAVWDVKNIFELKNARQVVVDGNVMENHWQGAQPGPAVVFTPRNQGGTAPWSVVRDVQFVNNRIRHVAAAFNILGYDNLATSQLTQNVVIANNVLEDVSAANWGGTGRLLIINGGDQITLDHNTVFQDGSSCIYGYGSQATNFRFTSNIAPQNDYGIFGDNSSPGMGAINQYFPGSIITGNLIVGGTIAYPAGNYYPATMAAVGFIDLAGGDYGLASTSSYKGVAAGGTDPGADMTKVPR